MNIADIQVNIATGSITYPKVEGFSLDMEKVYRQVALFLPHCATTEQAVVQAVHQQIIAHTGMAGIRRLAGKAVAS